jgi:hypothetical protein
MRCVTGGGVAKGSGPGNSTDGAGGLELLRLPSTSSSSSLRRCLSQTRKNLCRMRKKVQNVQKRGGDWLGAVHGP